MRAAGYCPSLASSDEPVHPPKGEQARACLFLRLHPPASTLLISPSWSSFVLPTLVSLVAFSCKFLEPLKAALSFDSKEKLLLNSLPVVFLLFESELNSVCFHFNPVYEEREIIAIKY